MTKTTEIELAQKACADLNEEIGMFANASISVYAKRICAHAYFAADDRSRHGMGTDFNSVDGETPLKAVEALRAKWDEQKSRRENAAVKATALAIIRITFEQGKCTDAALRCEVPHALTDEIIEKATSTANNMAEGGPFSVIAIRGANAA